MVADPARAREIARDLAGLLDLVIHDRTARIGDGEPTPAHAPLHDASADEALTALADSDATTRLAALRALHRLRRTTEIPDLVATLLRVLGEDEHTGVRDLVVELLGEIGPAAGEAAPALLAEARQRARYAPGPAAAALARIGATDLLAARITDEEEDTHVRLACLGAARETADPTTTAAAVETLGSRDGFVREAAIDVVRHLHERSPGAVARVFGLLEDPMPGAREAARLYLAHLAPSGFVATLDDRMAEPCSLERGYLLVDWLRIRRLFDFVGVEIVHASDADVEAFAIQVRNEPDERLRRRLTSRPCSVARGAGLSVNTRRILERTFGSVELAERARSVSTVREGGPRAAGGGPVR